MGELKELPPPGVPVVLDVETTGFVDDRYGDQPFCGDRAVSWGVATLDGAWSTYVPLRHYDGDNVELEGATRWLSDLVRNRRVINHNVKFDAHFAYVDGVDWLSAASIEDLWVISRLTHNDLPSYQLHYLAAVFNAEHRKRGKDLLTPWRRRAKTKDYAKAPVELLGEYAESDALVTADCFRAAEERLPDLSRRLWSEVEVPLTRELLRVERRGFPVKVEAIKRAQHGLLARQVQLWEEVNQVADFMCDPGADEDVSQLLMGQLGFHPLAFTKSGKPQWDSMALETLNHPVGKLLSEYSKNQHFLATYVEGWLKRVDEQELLHPGIAQAGAATGRMSCRNPSLFNVPVEAEAFVEPHEADEVLLSVDYSQIEYRLFGHYANDARVLAAFLENPFTDFHQSLATRLGVDRQFAKQLNFSFVYGMGRAKLLKNLAATLKLKEAQGGAGEMKAAMRTLLMGAGTQTAKRAEKLDTRTTDLLAQQIYDSYHREFPSIRALQTKVKRLVKRRGWVRNVLGRVYRFNPEQGSHKALNYVIQGGAADIFKVKVLRVLRELEPRWGAKLLIMVHDSLLFSVKESELLPFMLELWRLLEDPEDWGLRLPLIVDMKVSGRSWGHARKVKAHPLTHDPVALATELASALAASRALELRGWGAS